MSSNNLSNVGASYLYENDDQRTFSREEERERRRYREGDPGTYRPWERPHSEADIYKKDPTLPVKFLPLPAQLTFYFYFYLFVGIGADK
jgi:hypothetical protein